VPSHVEGRRCHGGGGLREEVGRRTTGQERRWTPKEDDGKLVTDVMCGDSQLSPSR